MRNLGKGDTPRRKRNTSCSREGCPITFLHCADIHLDAPFTSFDADTQKAWERRQDLRQVLIDIIDIAEKEKVDMILISGDLFEHNYVKKSTISFINDQFSRIPYVKIFIVPGNHDPNIASSYYKNYIWASNVHILTQDKPYYEIADIGVCVQGIGFMQFSSENPGLCQVKPANKNFVNILMIHGTLDMSIGSNIYNPVRSSELDNLDMDYIAFGHFHKKFEALGAKKNIYNPGSPEPLGFDEEGSHGVFIGTITMEHDGSSYINTDFVELNRKYYLNENINIDGLCNDEQIIAKLKDFIEKGIDKSHLLSINLTGCLDQEFKPDLQYISSCLKEYVYFLKLTDSTTKDYDLDQIAREPGLRGLFVRKMLIRIDNSKDEEEKSINKKALYYGLEALERGEIMCL